MAYTSQPALLPTDFGFTSVEKVSNENVSPTQKNVKRKAASLKPTTTKAKKSKVVKSVKPKRKSKPTGKNKQPLPWK